ncbi:MAG TPA: dockerin type I domain-containing protein [Gemmatimonadaceae bacterium]|nr:dockerin type I domain-containing protein [Gemmatimonadaceae bacterium]
MSIRRRAFVAASAAAAAGVVAMSTFARTARAQVSGESPSRRVAVPASMSGPISVLWADDFKHHTATPLTYVFDRATRRSYEVHLDSATVKRVGGVNRLRGLRATLSTMSDGHVTSIQPSGGARFITTVPGTPMWTTRRVLVLPCRTSDSPTPFGSVQDFQSLWFNGPMSVAAFWQESSYGQLNVTGDVLDWITVPGTAASYESGGTLQLATFIPACEALIPASVDVSKYDVVAYELGIFYPVELGGYADSSTVRGVTKAFGTTVSGYQASPQSDMGSHAHEFGHALSLFHSSTDDGFGYTSDWDIMSNATAYTESGINFGAEAAQPQKDLLGYIPVARRFVATGASSTITLERAATPAGNTNYLLAVIPLGSSDSASDPYYTVELRQHAGFDRDTPLEGVVVHQRCTVFACLSSQSFNVQDRDGNGNPNDHGAVLQSGESFVDKAHAISISVVSITGTSAQVTIHNGFGRNFALSRTGSKSTVAEGIASASDAIDITASGPGGATWAAANQQSGGQWLQVLTPTGCGSGTLRFQRNVAQLAPGTYYDTLNITSTAATSVHQYIDTLVVTPGTALHVGLSAVAHVDSNFAGVGHNDSTLVRIAGAGGASAQWTATRRKNFGFASGSQNLVTLTGTGNGVAIWPMVTLSTTATGWYVDTITVKLTANPTDSAVFFDSLLVVPPVQYALSTTGRRDSILAGGLSKPDSIAVSFSGLWATRASWTLTTGNRSPRFLVPVERGGFANTYAATGNATAYFQWIAQDTLRGIHLEPGTYIDTLLIVGPFPGGSTQSASSQKQQRLIDTLVVYNPSATAGLQLSSAARADTIAQGLSSSVDSVLVVPVGPGADTLQWAASILLTASGETTPGGAPAPLRVALPPGTGLPQFGGRGRGWVRYERVLTGLAPGRYANVLPIASLDGHATATLFDTLVILPGTQLSLGQTAHIDSIAAQSTTSVTDSVNLFVVGINASTTAWTATKRRSFTTLATASGTGPTTLRWTISPSGLAAGVYVDTITVSAGSNARGASIVNTIFVGGGPVKTVAAAGFDVDSVGGVLNYQFATTLSVNVGPLNQTLGSYAAIVDWDSTVVQLDSAAGVSGGFAKPASTQSNKARVSLSATDPAGKSGSVPLAQLYFHFSASNIGKTTSITPTFTSAKTPGGTDFASSLGLNSAKAEVIPGALRGDVNLDGRLTSADALLLVRSIVGFPGPGTPLVINPNGDANCNGKVEAVDVQYILAKLVGLPVGSACVGTIK